MRFACSKKQVLPLSLGLRAMDAAALYFRLKSHARLGWRPTKSPLAASSTLARRAAMRRAPRAISRRCSPTLGRRIDLGRATVFIWGVVVANCTPTLPRKAWLASPSLLHGCLAFMMSMLCHLVLFVDVAWPMGGRRLSSTQEVQRQFGVLWGGQSRISSLSGATLLCIALGMVAPKLLFCPKLLFWSFLP